MLKKHPSFPGIEGPILTVIMDGVGLNDSPDRQRRAPCQYADA